MTATLTPYPRRYKAVERFFAWFLKMSEPAMNRAYGNTKQQLFADLHGDVLEIGPGTGVNMPYLPKDIRLTGVEPNPFLFPQLEAHAKYYGLNVTLLEGIAEDLPVHDNSMDAVVCTLVLCSVYEPAKVLQEVLRVLKPGGRFYFIEHVAAPQGSLTRRTQEVLHAPWQCAGDGCNLNRETWTTLEQAGFSALDLQYQPIETPFKGLIRRHILGTATK